MTAIEESAGLLAECLEEIHDALVELTAVFRVKRTVLARGDMQALGDLLAREESVAEALFNAETRREVLASEMAAMTDAASERLVDIVAAVPEEAAELLVESGSRLRDAMGVLVREAGIVAEICRAAMEHYDRLIRIVTGAGLGGATYTPAGRSSESPRRNIIDQAI